jgi:hypothetical protein
MDDQYANRDCISLELNGGFYSKHVSAMTTEALHSKSKIAAELAHRDSEIDRLEKEISRYSCWIAITDQKPTELDGKVLCKTSCTYRDGSIKTIYWSSTSKDIEEWVIYFPERQLHWIFLSNP